MASSVLSRIQILMEANTANFTNEVRRARANSSRDMRAMASAAKNAAKGISLALVGAGLAVAKLGTDYAQLGRDITNFSNISSMGVEEFQAQAEAAKTVGIETEQLADMYKDAKEKLGDYLNTGGGGFQDFGDAIGASDAQLEQYANQWKDLPADQVLQNMKNIMDESGVSIAQQSHALEGMASDTTALIPLLENGGQKAKELADYAKNSGAILSEKDIAQAALLADNMDKIKLAFTGANNSIMRGLTPHLIQVSNVLAERIPIIVSNIRQFAQEYQVVERFKTALGLVRQGFENLASVVRAVGEVLAPVINWFREHEELSIALATGIAGVVGAFVTWNAALAIGAGVMTLAAGAFALLTSPITLIVVAITGLVAAGVYLYRNWEEISAKGTAIWTGIKVSINGVVQSIKDKFSEFINSFKTQFSSISAVVSGVIGTVKSVISTQMNAVKATFSSVMASIKSLVSSGIQGVVSAFSKGLSNARSLVIGGVNNIVTAFRTLGTKLVSVGRDAMQGFINGLKAKITGALSVVTNFVDRVKNAFTRTKGLDIHSPSRVTKEYGINTGDGFVIGLQSTIGKAVGVANSFVEKIKSSFDVMKNYTLAGDKFDLGKATLEANKQIIGSIQTLRKELVLFGDNSKTAAFEYEVAMGNMQYASKEYIEEYRKGLTELDRLETQLALNTKAEKSLLQRFEAARKHLEEENTAFGVIKDRLLTADEKRIELLTKQLALVTKMGDESEKVRLSNMLLEGTSAVSDYKKVYNTDGRSYGETNLDDIRKANLDSEAEYDKQMKILTTLEMTESVQQRITELESNQAEKRKQIANDELEAHRHIMQERLDLAGSGFGTLTSLTKNLFGESSKASKVAFAIEKANTLATILLKSKQAIATAWASAPFPQNLGAVAMATIKTGALSAVANSISGQAHDGLDYVPREGTYILDEGERVVKPYDNKRLSKFLDNTEANKSNGANNGANTTINTVVNVSDNGAVDVKSNNAIGKELGQAITATVQKVLRQETRQGGMLAR